MKKSKLQKISAFVKNNFIYILMCVLSVTMLAVNFSLTPAHASPQIAMTVVSAKITGNNPRQISSKFFAMNENRTGDFELGNIALQAGQKLEIDYHVGKLLSNDLILGMSLDTSELRNINVQLFVEESSTNVLKSFDLTEGNYYTNLSKSDIELKVVVSVADESMSAQILGKLCLSVRELGEDNGGNS